MFVYVCTYVWATVINYGLVAPKYLPKMLNTVVSILEGFIRRNTSTHRKQETHIRLHE